jgi:HD-GYP domain-containing protein (c-di-GMP phosphodiesterase class II)
MELKEISVDELQFGMYVSKLDRPWTETPFMFQGFVLKSEKQIDVLRKHCKKVFVDPEKEDLSEIGRVTAEDIAKVRGTTVYKEAASVEVELPRAKTAFTRSTAVVKELSRTVEVGNSVDSNRSKEAATQITESVVRNPDAMALLIKLQEKSGATLSRAVEISVMMTIFGRFLQFPHDRLEILGMMGLLQDVGKLKLPTELAARGPINHAEIELYRTHVNHSVEILSNTPGVPGELPGLASLHHERYDGSGYPRGLRGDAIALFGLIAGIVDSYDSLTAPPPFGEHLSPANALNIIYKGRGKLFHPALVEQFIQCIGVFPVGSIVEMNSGEIAVVYAQNMVRRLQPRVMVVQDANGNPVIPYKMLDLMREPKVRADEPYRIVRTLEFDAVKIDPREFFL